MRHGLAALALAMLPAMPAAANDRDNPDEGRICLSIWHPWFASIEETRRIESDPIPASYRREYGWSGCRNFRKTDLIEWHAAFGSEASITRALEFLAQTALSDMPAPTRFERDLSRLWKHNRGKDADMEPNALHRMAAAHERYTFLAAGYLRGAEMFGSTVLLERGRRYLGPVSAGLRTLYDDARINTKREDAPWDRIDLNYATVGDLRDLEMRYAILSARLSGRPEDAAAAEAAILANRDAVISASRDLLANGLPLCAEAPENPLYEACTTEANLADRIWQYWRSAAEWQVMAGRAMPGERSWDNRGTIGVAVKAARTEPAAGADFSRSFGDHDDAIAWLLILHADAKLKDTGDNFGKSNALDALLDAARLVAPSENPNRFRQIATRYLAIYRAMPADRWTGYGTRYPRNAVHFQRVLDGMKAIAEARTED